MIETAGYHTLEDRGNGQQLEDSGPEKCTSPKAWLGHGYYFWDTEIKWAHKWGKQYNGYLIFEAMIFINEKTYDLFGSVKHINDFIACINHLLKTKHFKDHSDILVPNILEYIKVHTKFETTYNSIRCADYPNQANIIKFKKNGSEETYIGGNRVQLCLINKENIKPQTFKLFFPENL